MRAVHILIDASCEGVIVPKSLATDAKLVLNLTPSAIDKLEMTNDHLSFSARFGGGAQNVYCPIDSILAIYAQENGEGMMFEPDSKQSPEAGDVTPQTNKAKKSARPGLKVVK